MARRYQDSEETPAEVAQSEAETLTVGELAEKHGQTYNSVVGGEKSFTRSHLGADAAHGWQRHMAYKSQPVKLSDADYLAALAAFDKGEVHEPANKRSETVFTPEQAEARMAQSKKVAAMQKAKATNSAPRYMPNQAHAHAMQKARTLAQSSGVKMRGS